LADEYTPSVLPDGLPLPAITDNVTAELQAEDPGTIEYWQ